MDYNNQNFNNQPNSLQTIFQWVGLACSSLGCLLTAIFSIVTCARGYEVLKDKGELGMSKWIIGVIIAAIVAVAGVVFSVLAVDFKTKKINKIVMVGLAVGLLAILWAIIPNATICAYNCVVNG